MAKLKIVDSGRLSSEKIMEKDAYLLENLCSDLEPVLHFYEWADRCLTYGYFTKPQDYLNLAKINQLDLKMARRPTGGGVIFHLTDLAFSLLVPANHMGYSVNSLDNYFFVNQHIVKALTEFIPALKFELWKPSGLIQEMRPNFCMAKPTQFDILVAGKKVAGAAQRKKKWGFLHQASILLNLPPVELIKAVIKDPSLFQATCINSYNLLPHLSSNLSLKEVKALLRIHLEKIFKDVF